MFTICFSQKVVWGTKTHDKVIFVLECVVFICFSMDILFNFMRLPNSKDDESLMTHTSIAKRYVISVQFVVDTLATFPFFLLNLDDHPKINDHSNGMMNDVWKGLFLKLLRLARLPRLMRVFDMEKCSAMFDCFFSGNARGKKVIFQNFLKNIFRVIKLGLTTIFVTYLIGCFFYMISDLQMSDFDYDGPTFVSANFQVDNDGNNIPEDEQATAFFRLITCCYFAITTLSTVGYGDLTPMSPFEMILVIVFMLVGVAYFSYIMSSFIEIIAIFNTTGVEEKTFELHNWLILLTRFRENRPLPNSLYRQINSHFKYYWGNNRLSSIQKKNEFIQALPRSIKRGIVVHYVWDDFFYNFRFFFNL